MSNFKTRLIEERDQLEERYTKLEAFKGTEQFKNLPEIQRILLQQQAVHMLGYLLSLEQRLTAL